MLKQVDGHNIGIKIDGTPINNFRFAYETVLLTETLEDLQILLNKVVERYHEYYGPLDKKFMLISKSTKKHWKPMQPMIVEWVKKYNNLGILR